MPDAWPDPRIQLFMDLTSGMEAEPGGFESFSLLYELVEAVVELDCLEQLREEEEHRLLEQAWRRGAPVLGELLNDEPAADSPGDPSPNHAPLDEDHHDEQYFLWLLAQEPHPEL